MTDRVAIITGGSRGIGRATALGAAARGFRVVVGYASNETAAKEVVASIERKNGKAIALDGSEVAINLPKPALTGAAKAASEATSTPAAGAAA